MAHLEVTKRAARLICPEERSEALHLAGVDITPLVSADQSDDYEFGVISGQDGHGPPPHSHPWDETYFVLRGEVVFGVGRDEQVCSAGALFWRKNGHFSEKMNEINDTKTQELAKYVSETGNICDCLWHL